MRKFVFLCIAAVIVSSCGGPKTLYYWGGETKGTTMYENSAYLSYDKQTPKSICNLIAVYEDMVRNPKKGLRKVPAPGICAEYGYLLLKPEAVQAFENNASSSQKKLFGKKAEYAVLFRERAEEMFKMEMELYPESQQFLKPLFEKLSK
ncbi:MAG: hypothetical protein ACI3Y2_01320 [Candidatus Egerieousia sp.]